MRTSYAQGAPPESVRGGYRVIRKAGRYMVFPRGVAGRADRPPRPRDGLVEIWNGMPWLTPLWARGPKVTWVHHVHGPMWGMVLPPRPGPRSARSSSAAWPRRSTGASTSSRCRSRRAQRAGRPARTCDPTRVAVVPPGVDPRFSPGRRRSPRPARGGRRPADAGQAVRRPHPRAGRRCASGCPTSSSSSWATAPSASASRTWSTPSTAPSGSACRAGLADDDLVGALPPGVGAGQRVGGRGLGHDHHRGRRLRHAGRRHRHRRPPRRRRRRRDRRAGRRPGRLGAELAALLTDDARRRRLAAAARARAADLHVGGHRRRHPRRAGRRRRPDAGRPRTGRGRPNWRSPSDPRSLGARRGRRTADVVRRRPSLYGALAAWPTSRSCGRRRAR